MQGKHVCKFSPVLYIVSCLLMLVLMASISILFFPSKAKAAAGTIVVHSVLSAQIPVGQKATLTATCASGEQMVGGGFSGNAFEGAVHFTDNYPSGANAWTGTIDNTIAPSWVQVAVSVYCLQASYLIAPTIVHASGSGAGTTTANCPDGSVLLSGGYVSGGGISAPNGNGWQAYGTDVYVLCATQSLRSASSASTAFSSPGGFGSSRTGTANCAIGQLATGGGFNSAGASIISSNGTSTNWSITVAGTFSPVSVTAWVVCVNPPTADPTPTITVTPASGVHVAYHMNAQWPGGFSATMTVTNKSSTTVQGWNLQFSFPEDQKITQSWSSSFSQTGQQVTITNVDYNKVINPGQTITLGFNGTWTSNNTSPTTFLLNGAATS